MIEPGQLTKKNYKRYNRNQIQELRNDNQHSNKPDTI